MKTAIVLNAPYLNLDVTENVIICADGGFRLLKNRKPDVVLGDFDSLETIPSDVKILKVPAEKNFTDGEMAVRYAVESGADEIALYGVAGGRIDHVVANFALLKLAFSLGVKAVAKDRDFTAEYVEGTVERTAPVGSTVSLIPYGGDVAVAFSEGLYYPLNPLFIGLANSSRGMSNVTTARRFVYGIESGGAILIVNSKSKS